MYRRTSIWTDGHPFEPTFPTRSGSQSGAWVHLPLGGLPANWGAGPAKSLIWQNDYVMLSSSETMISNCRRTKLLRKMKIGDRPFLDALFPMVSVSTFYDAGKFHFWTLLTKWKMTTLSQNNPSKRGNLSKAMYGFRQSVMIAIQWYVDFDAGMMRSREGARQSGEFVLQSEGMKILSFSHTSHSNRFFVFNVERCFRPCWSRISTLKASAHIGSGSNFENTCKNYMFLRFFPHSSVIWSPIGA